MSPLGYRFVKWRENGKEVINLISDVEVEMSGYKKGSKSLSVSVSSLEDASMNLNVGLSGDTYYMTQVSCVMKRVIVETSSKYVACLEHHHLKVGLHGDTYCMTRNMQPCFRM